MLKIVKTKLNWHVLELKNRHIAEWLNGDVIVDGVERFWRGDRVPEGKALDGLLQGGPITWWRPRENAACETQGW